jgi:hypothetical protein
MPGQFGSDSRPPRYELKINSTAPDNQGVYAEAPLTDLTPMFPQFMAGFRRGR